MLLALLASMMSGGGAAAAPKGGCPRCDAKPTDHPPDRPKGCKGKAKMPVQIRCRVSGRW